MTPTSTAGLLTLLSSRRGRIFIFAFDVAIVGIALATGQIYAAIVIGALYVVTEAGCIFSGWAARRSRSSRRGRSLAVLSFPFAVRLVVVVTATFLIWRFVLTPELPVAWDAAFAAMSGAVGIVANLVLRPP